MFSFLLGVLGLGYLGIRCANEKQAGKIHDNHDRIRSDVIKSLEKYNPPMMVQNEVNTLLNGNHFEEICNELEQELIFILGKNFRETLYIPPNGSKKWNSWGIEEIVKMLLYAKRGYVRMFDLHGHFRLGFPHCEVCGISEYGVGIRGMQCVERLLHKAGATDIILKVERNINWHTPEGSLTEAGFTAHTNSSKWAGCYIYDSRFPSIPGLFRAW